MNLTTYLDRAARTMPDRVALHLGDTELTYRPRRIELVDALPRTGSGKLDRPSVRIWTVRLIGLNSASAGTRPTSVPCPPTPTCGSAGRPVGRTDG